MSATVVIPCKSLTGGKTRLAGVLADDVRARLCREMLERTMAIAAGIGDVIVVSDDVRVASVVARRPGPVRFVQASSPGDLNSALDQVRRVLSPASAMLVLPTDLMLLDRRELAAFLEHPEHLHVAPDRAFLGTNLLLLPCEAVPRFRFSFGYASLFVHTREARRLGFKPRFFDAPGTRMDIDTPADLAEAQQYAQFSFACSGLPDHAQLNAYPL